MCALQRCRLGGAPHPPAGRFLLTLTRFERTLPAIILGGIGFLYLFGAGVLGVLELPVYTEFLVTPDPLQPDFLPFEQPMVNVIFGLGAFFVFAAAAEARRRRHWGCRPLRHAKRPKRSSNVSHATSPAFWGPSSSSWH